jgi:hypothetical protein
VPDVDSGTLHLFSLAPSAQTYRTKCSVDDNADVKELRRASNRKAGDTAEDTNGSADLGSALLVSASSYSKQKAKISLVGNRSWTWPDCAHELLPLREIFTLKISGS